MDIHIELSRDDVAALLTHIPDKSKLRRMLEKSSTTKPTSAGLQITFESNTLVCSTSEAIHMLSLVNQHCPEISVKIKKGFQLAGLGGDSVRSE